jgi:hypothetical protein
MTDTNLSMLPSLGSGGPQLTRYNPPGQSALFYRPGAYSSIVSRMLDELRKQKVTAQDAADSQPLIHFNTLARDDWTVAFLRAWATVSDVLSFYQERMINEGYLRTAIERRSVLELTRAVGYELAPAVSATTYLAFTVHDALPGVNVQVPRGTAVQSVPQPFSSSQAIQDIVQGQASPVTNIPVIFETTEDLTADAAWNALMPSLIQGQHWPRRGTDQRSLRLAGSTLSLKPGDLLLIASRQETSAVPPDWQLLLLSKVDAHAKEGYTAVGWDHEYGMVPEEGIPNPAVYVFRHRVPLFPYVAGAVFRKWETGWAPTNIGLPPKAVQAAAAGREGRLYVGIGQAVYSSDDRGDSWRSISAGLPAKDVHAVAASVSGAVAVGTDDSGVLLSNDGGKVWSTLNGPGEVEIPTGWRRFVESVRYKLPKTTIRSLMFTEDNETLLLAGSDDGVFGYDPRHDSWVSMNEHLPDLDRKKGTAPLAVHALVAAKEGKRILAGTDKGVFSVEALFNGPSSALLTALLVLLLSGTSNSVIPAQIKEFPHLNAILAIGVLFILLIWQQPFRQKWVGYVLAVVIYVVLAFGTGVNGFNRFSEQTIYLTAVFVNLVFLGWNLLRAAAAKLPDLVRKSPGWVKELLPALFRQGKHPNVFSLQVNDRVIYAATDDGIYRLDPQSWMARFKHRCRRLLLGPEPEPWAKISGWDRTEDPADGVVTALALNEHGCLLAGALSGRIYEQPQEPSLLWKEAKLPLRSVQAVVTLKSDIFAMGEPLDALQEVLWAPAQLDAGAVDVDALSLTLPINSFAAAMDGDSSAVFRVADAREQPSHDVRQPGRLTRLTVNEKQSLSGFQNRFTTQFFCQSEPLALFDDQFLPEPIQGDRLILAGQVTGLEPGKVMLISGKVPDGEYCSEPITVQEVKPDRLHEKTTTLQLKKPLVNKYDLESVIVHGNVVPALQGKTIRNEYLGESDGTIPNQRFVLSSPLAYEPVDANDYQTSLSVQVNKIRWNQVPSLLDQAAGARVYMVRGNDQGQTVIIFGDGEQGARLPTSREILTATYRSGSGEAGNVAPNSLTMLQSHLPHIKGVTNPAPALGGLPAESKGHGREQAPRRVRALERIVTLKDYGDFSSTFPGVSQAAARAWPENQPRWIDIVIVPKYNPQTEASQFGPLLNVLKRAIEQSRSSAVLPFKLRSCRRVSFFLAMQLYVLPDAQDDDDRKSSLIQTVRKKILQAYSLEMQTLGRAVTEPQIFQLVQSVPGVSAVTLTQFEKHSPPSQENSVSSAGSILTADWDELLVIDNEKDLKVGI